VDGSPLVTDHRLGVSGMAVNARESFVNNLEKKLKKHIKNIYEEYEKGKWMIYA
jgi:hypothetical protein